MKRPTKHRSKPQAKPSRRRAHRPETFAQATLWAVHRLQRRFKLDPIDALRAVFLNFAIHSTRAQLRQMYAALQA